MSFIPRPHEIYKHFKGNLYQVTALAEHSETGEQLVIYQAMYGDFKTYARPLAMFVDRVDREKYPEAAQEFRFQLQGPEAGRQAAESAPENAGKESAAGGRKEAVPDRTATGERKAAAQQEEMQQEWVRQEEAQQEEVWQRAQQREAQQQEAQDDELALDPLLLEFLDSDSYEQKLNILAGLHHRITNEMLTTMAIACDIEINEGDIEERYEALRACLLTLEHYECNRLR